MVRQYIRLHARWLPGLIVAIMLVEILVGALAIHYVETSLVASSGESLTLAAVDIADKLDMQMAERYGDILMLSRSLVFQGNDQPEKQKRLLALLETYPVYRWAGVTDEQGRILAATDEAGKGRDMSGEPGFLAVRASQRAVIQDAIRDDEGVSVVTFVSPLNDARGQFIGAVISKVGLPVLEDVVARSVNALQALWGTGARIEYLLLDHDGNVFVDSFLREEGRVNLKQMGGPSAQLFDTAPAGFIEERHVRRQVEVVTGYAQTKGTHDLTGLGWGVLVRVDRSDILVPIRAVLWKVGAAGFGLVVPLIALLMWNVSRLTHSWAASDAERTRTQAAELKFHSFRKQAEKALREREASNTSVLNSLSSQIVVLNSQGVIIAVNKPWQRFAEENGAPHLVESFVGMNYLNVCAQAPKYTHGVEAAAAQAGILAVLAGTQSEFSLEYPCHSPDQQRWFCMRVTPMLDSQAGVVVAHENITERKRVEDALREREEALARFKTTLDQTLDCVFMFTPDTLRFIYCNRGACEQIGYSEAELFTMTPLDIKPNVTPQQFQALLQPLREGILPSRTFETLHRHKDGHDIPVEIALQLARIIDD